MRKSSTCLNSALICRRNFRKNIKKPLLKPPSFVRLKGISPIRPDFQLPLIYKIKHGKDVTGQSNGPWHRLHYHWNRPHRPGGWTIPIRQEWAFSILWWPEGSTNTMFTTNDQGGLSAARPGGNRPLGSIYFRKENRFLLHCHMDIGMLPRKHQVSGVSYADLRKKRGQIF